MRFTIIQALLMSTALAAPIANIANSPSDDLLADNVAKAILARAPMPPAPHTNGQTNGVNGANGVNGGGASGATRMGDDAATRNEGSSSAFPEYTNALERSRSGEAGPHMQELARLITQGRARQGQDSQRSGQNGVNGAGANGVNGVNGHANGDRNGA